MNTHRGAARLAALLTAALLWEPADAPAQDVATETDLFRPLSQEEQVRYSKYLKERDDALKLEQRAREQAASWERLTRSMSWLFGDQPRTPEERIYLAGRSHVVIPQIPYSRAAVNSYGASLDVPHGRYRGNGLIGLEHMVRDQIGGGWTTVSLRFTHGARGRRSLGHGWSFEPGGMLREYYVVVGANTQPLPGRPPVTTCDAVSRFAYYSAGGTISFQNRGLEQPCRYQVDGEANVCGPAAASHCDASRPTQLWSTTGHVALDVSDRQAPVLRFPDGRAEVMGEAGPGWEVFELGLFDPVPSGFNSIRSLTFTQTRADRNGNLTRFEYPSESLTRVIDPRGRITRYERTPGRRVSAIRVPGLAGQDLVWEMTWTGFTWRPADTFPEVECSDGLHEFPCEDLIGYGTLTALRVPDGRSYTFTYEPWGALKTVTEPNGAVTEFQYGVAGTPAFPAPRLGQTPAFVENLDQRRLVASVVRPDGPSGPAHTTTIEHERSDPLGSEPGVGICGQVRWVKTTRPDGSILREGLCGGGGGAFASQVLAIEQWEGSVLKDGHYYGNIGQPGGAGPLGKMAIDFERGEAAGVIYLPGSDGDVLDVRPTRITHVRDGVGWVEQRRYEASDIPATAVCQGCPALRTWGNLTRTELQSLSGETLVQTDTTYFHPPAYVGRNLITLPDTVTTRDPERGVVSRQSFRYDEYDSFPLRASGAANLVDVGPARGNATTAVREKLVEPGDVSTHSRYYDTGDLFQATDGNGNPTTSNLDFRLCSQSATLEQTAENVLQHRVTTVRDCHTDLALTVTDPNSQATRTIYDRLGRVVSVIGPGDSEASPSAWNEYCLRGSTANSSGCGSVDRLSQRTVTHAKDGSTQGMYVKTFLDGLGRAVETRIKGVSEAGVVGEIVATVEYDGMGRASRASQPSSASASDTRSGSAGPFTTTTHDALGRVTSVTAPGDLATSTSYSSSGSEWLATTTLPNQNQTRSYTDLLGHTVRTERFWAEGGGRWLARTFRYDAAGRLLEQEDPGGNTVVFTYDGLGRILTMNDPDMGGGFTCWPDQDGDGFGAGTPVIGTGCPAGYVANNGDCFDSNADVRPGQTGCFTSPRSDGSYDYDCSGAPTLCNGPGDYITSCSGPCSVPCSFSTAPVTTSQCGASVPVGCRPVGCPPGRCEVHSMQTVACR